MNLRAEVTKGARILATDGSTTCPSLSPYADTRGKQIRAVALDRIASIAFRGIDYPSFSLVDQDDPLGYLARESSDHLKERCINAIDEPDGEKASEMYSSTLDLTDFEIAKDVTILELDTFLYSATAFTAESIRLASVAKDSTSPEELYRKLYEGGYGGMAKKFTGGRSLRDINYADRALKALVAPLGLMVSEEKDAIRTCPQFIREAANTLHPATRQLLEEQYEDEDRTALCIASIAITEGVEPVAERVWKWTVRVAQNSEFIELLRQARRRSYW